MPPLNLATWSGFSAITLPTAASISAVSVIWRRPFSSTMEPGSPPVSTMTSNTSLAMRPEMVSAAIRSSSRPRFSADTGDSAMPSPFLFSAPNRFEITQLAAALASRPLATAS